MELYLNRIYFGGGLYGAEAAATRLFLDKPASEMTLAECATLAGLVKSPNKLLPLDDREGSARSAQLCAQPDGGTRFHQRSPIPEAQGQEMVVGNRQNARGQNYAIDNIRQQVIAARRLGPRDERRVSASTPRSTPNCKMWRRNHSRSSRRRRRDAGLPSPNLRPVFALLKERRGTAPNEKVTAPPAPEYLQGR
jgi:hypothetical protein